MKVAVIGTGNIGRALGASLVRAGHEVTFAAQDQDKARQLAGDVGARAATSAAAAAAEAQVVVLAVPYAALTQVAAEIAPATDRVVVDVTNPLKPDYSGPATDGGPSAAEQLAELLPQARVVKAFNTVFGSLQADPGALGSTVDALFATDDAEARATITRLIESLGLRPVDAGPLDAARQLESLAWLNIRMQLRTGGDWRSTFVVLGAPVGATPVAALAR